MDGPIKNERETLGNHLKWLERWLVFSGIVVVVGVFIEISSKVLKGEIDNEVIGGLLVILGVAAEVAIARVITLKSDRIQEIADIEVAQARQAASEARERAANTERLTAEADLARVRLETELRRRTVSRTLSKDEGDSFVNSLKQFSGQRFATYWGDLGGSPSKVAEKLSFVTQLRELFIEAGWQEEQQAQLPPKLDTPDAVTLYFSSIVREKSETLLLPTCPTMTIQNSAAANNTATITPQPLSSLTPPYLRPPSPRPVARA